MKQVFVTIIIINYYQKYGINRWISFMDVSKMKVLGILNFNGNIVEFIGDDEYIKNYFTSFYSSMINGNIEVTGESVKVHFISDYISNINNVINYYGLGDRLIYYEEENTISDIYTLLS